jgi:hypothetical protein
MQTINLLDKIKNNYPDSSICESCGKKNYNEEYVTFLQNRKFPTSALWTLDNQEKEKVFFEKFKNRCPTCFDFEGVQCMACGVCFLGPPKTYFCRTCEAIRHAVLQGDLFYYKAGHHYLPLTSPVDDWTKLEFSPNKMLQIKYSIFLSSNGFCLPHGFSWDEQQDKLFLGKATARYPLLANITQKDIDDMNNNTSIPFGHSNNLKHVNPLNYYLHSRGSACGGCYDCSGSPTYHEINDISIIDTLEK